MWSISVCFKPFGTYALDFISYFKFLSWVFKFTILNVCQKKPKWFELNNDRVVCPWYTRKGCLIKLLKFYNSSLLNSTFSFYSIFISVEAYDVYIYTFRCGMIYLDPLQLGWEPLVKSWMENELPEKLNAEQKDTIKVSC